MAISTGAGIALAAGIGGVGALGSGLMGMSAADKAADAQSAAAEDANALQWKMFQIGRMDQAPWRKVGSASMNYLAQILGIPGDWSGGSATGANALAKPNVQDFMKPGGTTSIDGTSPNDSQIFDRSGYQKAMDDYRTSLKAGDSGGSSTPLDLTNILRSTPGYEWTLNQGIGALDKSAAAKGRLFSGAQGKALTEYGTGLADQTYNNYLNRIFQTAGLGQSTANSGAAIGANVGNQMGSNILAGGNARASGYINSANALTGGLNSGMNNFLLASMMNKGGGTGYGSTPSSDAYTPFFNTWNR